MNYRKVRTSLSALYSLLLITTFAFGQGTSEKSHKRKSRGGPAPIPIKGIPGASIEPSISLSPGATGYGDSLEDSPGSAEIIVYLPRFFWVGNNQIVIARIAPSGVARSNADSLMYTEESAGLIPIDSLELGLSVSIEGNDAFKITGGENIAFNLTNEEKAEQYSHNHPPIDDGYSEYHIPSRYWPLKVEALKPGPQLLRINISQRGHSDPINILENKIEVKEHREFSIKNLLLNPYSGIFEAILLIYAAIGLSRLYAKVKNHL